MASIPITREIRDSLQLRFDTMLDRHELLHIDAFPMTVSQLVQQLLPPDVHAGIRAIRTTIPRMLVTTKEGSFCVAFNVKGGPFVKVHVHMTFAVPKPWPSYEFSMPGVTITEEHPLFPELVEWATEAWKIEQATKFVRDNITNLLKVSNTIGQVLYTWPKMAEFLTDEQKVRLGGSSSRSYAEGAFDTHASFREKYVKLNSWLAMAYMLPDLENDHSNVDHITTFWSN